VVCPLNSQFFSLADGTCLNADFAVGAYPVRDDEGTIVVDA
jgi:nitrite reductase/ring-hydroxylating ferredoxin subunit